MFILKSFVAILFVAAAHAAAIGQFSSSPLVSWHHRLTRRVDKGLKRSPGILSGNQISVPINIPVDVSSLINGIISPPAPPSAPAPPEDPPTPPA
jgi:hypothetical protein